MSDIEEEAFRYDKMVEKALRGVVHQALEEVIRDGLDDEHHFYITFKTDHAGVNIPDYLRERYPDEMTIVLQHQFYDLESSLEKFTVMLSFNNVPERLVIPLSAITIFADPSVNFALQFQPLEEDDMERDPDHIDFESEEIDPDKFPKDEKKGEVVSLDSFRKKNTDKPKKPSNEENDSSDD